MKRNMVTVTIAGIILTLALAGNAAGGVVYSGMTAFEAQYVDQPSPSVPGAAATPRPEDDFQSSPVMFIENAGQWDDRARFQVWGGPAGTMWLADDAIWITLLENVPDDDASPPDVDVALSPTLPLTPSLQSGVNIKLSFVDANPHPQIETVERLDTTISYFLGNDPDQWRPEVPVWSGVRYVDLYPGVELEITSDGGELAQRLSAQPGADVSAMHLRVEGAAVAGIEDGELRLTTAIGPLSIALPTAGFPFQVEGLSAAGEAANWLAAPAPHGASQPLTPDDNPADLLYSTFLGGSSGEAGYAIAVDGAGSAYATGNTFSGDFPATPGAFDPGFNGGNDDGYVAKLNPAGSGLVYVTFLGGGDRDAGHAVAVDGAGNVYVTGRTASSNFPTTPGAYDRSHNGGGDDAFAIKLNPAGSGLTYGTFLGGNSFDGGNAIAVDGAGNAFLTGYTQSSDFPTAAGAFDPTFNGGTCNAQPCADAFVVKLNMVGSGLVYATFLGGGSDDWTEAIALDAAGNAYMTGLTASGNFPTTPGTFDSSFNGGNHDAFVAKLNPAGNGLVYGTFLGGSGSEIGFGIALDGTGSSYVAGQSDSGNFPTTPGAFDTSYNGGGDAFVTRLNSTGSGLDYGTFLGGSGSDGSTAIVVDGTRAAFLTGSTASSDFPTAAGFDPTFNGATDAFVARLGATGSGLAYASFLGGNSADYGHSIALDGAGNAQVTGRTASGNFPTTLGAFDRSYNGGNTDIFLAKLAVGAGQPTPTHTATATATATASPTPTSTATRTRTPTPTATLLPGLPTATPPLPTPTATPDFPVCTVAVDKIAYPLTARIDGQVGVTLRLTGDCPGQLGSAVDVALVIDRSDSMCDYMSQAQASGLVFIDAMALPPDQVGVISFAGTATMQSGLTGNPTQAANALNSITCGGLSRIDRGLERAYTEMSGPRRVAGHTPAVILLTDGNPEGSYADAVRQAAQPFHDAGIKLFTVGLGGDVNADLLREIATSPDHYYQAPTPNQLEQIYARLAGELRGRPAANINITDIIGPNFDLVPDSFTGAATPVVSGNVLAWHLDAIEVGATEVGFSLEARQCGTFNTNQMAAVSYDDNRGNRHTLSFPNPTVTITDCGGNTGDVMVRDNDADTGVVPSSPPWWRPPDVWVRHANDGGTQHQNPQGGQRNYIYARVTNRGAAAVANTRVDFFYAASGLGLGWPSAWTALAPHRTIASLAPGQSTVVSLPWDVPNIAGHFCLRVHLDAPQDPRIDQHVVWDNNVTQRNFDIVEYPQPPSGQCRLGGGTHQDFFPFDVINTLNTSAMVDLEISATDLPAGAQVWLDPAGLAGRWTSLNGLRLEQDGRLLVTSLPATVYGVRLNAQELQAVQMEVQSAGNESFVISISEWVRGNLVGGNSYQRVLPPCFVSLPYTPVTPLHCVAGRTYTVDADFDQGLLINVNHNAPNNNQLQLNDAVTPLPFIWIALSGRGTIAKVNTETGVVLGEYRTAPQGRYLNPSRTTVDLNGSVWVGNRDEATGGKGSVVRVGLRENYRCVDRNGNGVIETSSGLGDVRPWSNPGGIDNNGGVSSAADECIIDYLRVNGINVRTLAVDANNNVWVGGHGNTVHDLIDGSNGATLRTIYPNCGGYGGLVDSHGVLWSSGYPYSLLRYDSASNSTQCISMTNSYGLAVDSSGVIWNSRFTNSTVTRLDPAGNILSTVPTGGTYSRGVAVTSDDNIWIANTGSNTVTRLNNSGVRLATIAVGEAPTGVAVDAAGKVWVTNYGSNNAMRINPATNRVDLTVYLGAGSAPYNYSDMTGSVILSSPPQGKWVVIYDSGEAATPWGTASWHSQVPTGTSLTVRVRSAESPVALGSQPWVIVVNGTPFTTVPNGRYIQVEVQFTGTDQGATPILYDLTIQPRCAARDSQSASLWPATH